MRTCTRPGCEQVVVSEERHCYRCAKILAGLIDSTRGDSRLDILPVEMTSHEKATADAARTDYFARLSEAERARRNARRDELDEPWDRALGIRRPKGA